MPVTRRRTGRNVAVRGNSQLVIGDAPRSGKGIAVRGGRMLLKPEQPSGGEGGGDKSLVKIEAIPVGLLLAFVRRLIAHQVTTDAMYICLRGAQTDVGATNEEMKAFAEAVAQEYQAHRIWPAGF